MNMNNGQGTDSITNAIHAEVLFVPVSKNSLNSIIAKMIEIVKVSIKILM